MDYNVWNITNGVLQVLRQCLKVHNKTEIDTAGFGKIFSSITQILGIRKAIHQTFAEIERNIIQL